MFCCIKQKVASNSFSLQYMSLILIVLAFCVGAFLRGPERAEASALQEVTAQEGKNTEENAPKVELTHALIELNYDELFRGNELDESQLDVVLTLLRSHDIRAEFSISPESKSDGDYYLALARSITLSNFLENSGIPRQGWRVYVANQKHQVNLNLVDLVDANSLDFTRSSNEEEELIDLEESFTKEDEQLLNLGDVNGEL